MKDEEKKPTWEEKTNWEGETHWYKETDKSEVEVVWEWWRNELGDAPSNKQIENLEKEILKRNKRIKDAEKSYQGNDDITETFIIMEKKITKALQDLLDTFLNNDVQVGRPIDFEKGDSLRWFDDLKKQKEYQHKNGKPHKTRIREKIKELHEEKTGYKPSMKTIKRHV